MQLSIILVKVTIKFLQCVVCLSKLEVQQIKIVLGVHTFQSRNTSSRDGLRKVAVLVLGVHIFQPIALAEMYILGVQIFQNVRPLGDQHFQQGPCFNLSRGPTILK